jgi:ankyrin repeat protein
LLLNRKSFINAKTKNGFTALHLCSQNGHTELAKLLLERGADIQALTLNKKTPLHLAAQNGK